MPKIFGTASGLNSSYSLLSSTVNGQHTSMPEDKWLTIVDRSYMDLDPIGFNGWRIGASDDYGVSDLYLQNPNGDRQTVWEGNRWFEFTGSSTYYQASKTIMVYDDNMDSIIFAFSGSTYEDNINHYDGEMSSDGKMAIIFLAKDVNDNIFGGIGTTAPEYLLGKNTILKLSDMDLFQQKHIENDSFLLYLTNMMNLTEKDAPLAKTMMMAMTIPKTQPNLKRYGTYYSYIFNGKKYANLSCVTPSTRAQIFDPFCPY